MSLYNMIFGVNDRAPMLLKAIGLSPSDIPRFRDVYLTSDAIVVHTRTGGGNRDAYENEDTCRECYPEYFTGDGAPSGPWNDDLRANPYFVRDEDDDFDSTYADFYFRFPDHLADELNMLAKESPDVSPHDRWQALFAAMEQGK